MAASATSRRNAPIPCSTKVAKAASGGKCDAPDLAIAEKEAAEDAYNDCVLRSVARLDDGKSDPVSIAYGVQPTCAVLDEKLTQTVVSRAATQKGKDDACAMYKDGEIRAITNAVLFHRSTKQ